jgi:hypothetical protein
MILCIKIATVGHLPRRGNRTQPRVLILGFAYSGMCPHKAVIQECLVGIAPHDRGVEVAEGALDEGRRVFNLHNYVRRKESLV